MASLLLRPSALVVGLSFSSVLLAPLALRPRPLLLRCDASPEPLAGREWSYTRDARTPVRSQGRWNPQALKQVSAGSILGTLFHRATDKIRGFSGWKEKEEGGGLSDIRTQADGWFCRAHRRAGGQRVFEAIGSGDRAVGVWNTSIFFLLLALNPPPVPPTEAL